MTIPEPGSVGRYMLQKWELKVGQYHPDYPKNAIHVYAKNCHCDEWNDFMLEELNENLKSCHAWDTKKDTLTGLVNIVLPEKPHDTRNLRKDLHLKVGSKNNDYNKYKCQ